MVGRTRAGDSLVPIHSEPIPGTDPRTVTQNQFTYESDPVGARCPFGAHVRRTNPRNSDFPERRLSGLRKLMIMLGFGPKGFYDDLTSSVRFHRILRRGREYGSELLPEEALQRAPPNESARGLHFICLNANISRQFEFLQNAWITNTKFSGVSGESDPLLGNREPIPGCPVTDNFTIPGDGMPRRRVSGLPQFVMVRGGAYFFLPSLRALRYFAGA
jgi:deferrochelatase/peroxidase EfeB